MQTIHLACLSVWLWLYGIHPALPWALIPVAAWAVNWAIRSWQPGSRAWEAVTRALPGAVGSLLSKAVQTLPSVAMGAIVTALASGLGLRQTVLGALVALGAPVWHEFLKAIPVPYVGGVAPAAGSAPLPPKPPLPPVSCALLVLLALGCAPSLEAAHRDGIAARRGVATSAVGVAESARCQWLDDSRGALSGTAKALLLAGGVAGVALLMPEVRDSKGGRIAVVGGGVALTATGTGVQVVADQRSSAWVRECSTP